MAKIAKKLYFDIPGFGRVHALPDSTFDPGGQKRDPVLTDVGVAGYTEEPMAPSVQFKLANNGISLNDLRNLTDVNVSIQDDNGQAWIMRDAWVTEPPKLSGGEIDVSMTGVAADPVS